MRGKIQRREEDGNWGCDIKSYQLEWFSFIFPIIVHLVQSCYQDSGVQKSLHPTIPDGSMWSKFRARGEHGEHGKDGKHGDVLRFSN